LASDPEEETLGNQIRTGKLGHRHLKKKAWPSRPEEEKLGHQI
jgi:hypothetical protein